MKQLKPFLLGVFFGILLSFFGSYIFIEVFTSYSFIEGYKFMKSTGNLGKVITLGALLNIGLVFFLFHKNKDQMAKGVVFSLFLLTIYTLFA